MYYMNKNFSDNLCEKISLPEDIKFAAYEIAEKKDMQLRFLLRIPENAACSICKKIIQNNKIEGAAFSLAFCLMKAEKTKVQYAKKDIPDQYFYDSMRDITIWAQRAKKDDNVKGLTEIGWVKNSLYMHIIRIGRLQYQFYRPLYHMMGLNREKIKKLPIPNFSRVLNIHIPEDGKLYLSLCKDSLDEARKFFAKYYPEYQYKGFICESWLLDPKNNRFMDKNSNISAFSTLFDGIIELPEESDEIIKRLWGKYTKKGDIAKLPENTDLQSRTKAYIMAGGKTGSGLGFIIRKEE